MTDTMAGEAVIEAAKNIHAAALIYEDEALLEDAETVLKALAAQPSAGAQGEAVAWQARLAGSGAWWNVRPEHLKMFQSDAAYETRPLYATPAQPSAAVLQVIAAFQAISRCASGEPIKGQYQRFQAMEVSDAIDIAVGELLDALKMPAQPDTGEVAALRDPKMVHINMLRGGIAKLTPTQIGHLYRGEEAAEVVREVVRQNPDAALSKHNAPGAA